MTDIRPDLYTDHAMLAFWACAAVTAISAYVSLGYSIAGLRGAESVERTASGYALARSLALAITATIAPFTGMVAFIAAVAIAMIVVQAADAVIGGMIHDRLKTVGPAATSLVNAGGILWLLLA